MKSRAKRKDREKTLPTQSIWMQRNEKRRKKKFVFHKKRIKNIVMIKFDLVLLCRLLMFSPSLRPYVWCFCNRRLQSLTWHSFMCWLSVSWYHRIVNVYVWRVFFAFFPYFYSYATHVCDCAYWVLNQACEQWQKISLGVRLLKKL